MRVALVHDYLNQAGGAERVVAALHRLFPDAPIYTTIADPSVVRALFGDADVRTSWLQRVPGVRRFYRHYFLCYPAAIESLDLRGYDLVISSSSAYAKGAVTRPDAHHLCYCHTPMRFGWNLDGYAARERWNPVTRALLPRLVERVRRWDVATAHRPYRYLANSSVVAERIRSCYGRSSIVVPPPVDVDRFTPSPLQGDYHLVVSRLLGYKRIDLAIEAFNRMRRPLVIIGSGPARAELERLAGPTVRFLGRLSDPEVADYYARCRALIFPGEEDFGIAPLEANASGRPVVAYRAGGALDTVVEGQTGVFFEPQTVEALIEAVQECDALSWDAKTLRSHAAGYRESSFHARMRAVIADLETVRGDGADVVPPHEPPVLSGSARE